MMNDNTSWIKMLEEAGDYPPEEALRRHCSKLMRFNRVKSTNRFLIEFRIHFNQIFDSIPAVRLLVATNPIRNLGLNLNPTTNSDRK